MNAKSKLVEGTNKNPGVHFAGASQVGCHDESSTLREIRSGELIVQLDALEAVEKARRAVVLIEGLASREYRRLVWG